MSKPRINAAAASTETMSQPAPLSRDGARSARAASGRVSMNVARMEPWVSWTMAACTAWVALFAFPDVPVLWLFVLYAGLLGKWCHLFPSQRQGRMFVHGVALIFAAYLLQTHASGRVGGPEGLFFFWTAIPALSYAFMLQRRWAIALVAVAVAQFALSIVVLDRGGVTAVAYAGFLLIFPLALSLPFGEIMRKPDEQMEQSRIDSATGLFNADGLMVHGAELLRECRREKRPATVAVFACDDLMSVREMYGRKVGHKALHRLVAKLNALAGSRGLVARTGAAEFSLMLPGISRDKALQAIARQLGNPMRVEFEVGGEEIVILPQLAAGEARVGEASIDGLYVELRAELQELQIVSRQGSVAEDGLPLDSMPSIPVVAEADELGLSTFINNMPATMPVPLGAQ